jgi:iron complex outermembrane receptor protein
MGVAFIVAFSHSNVSRADSPDPVRTNDPNVSAGTQPPAPAASGTVTDAERDSNALRGLKKRAEELPTSKTVVSEKQLESRNANDATEAVKDVAGVTSANSKTAENSSINVRGIPLNLYTSYRLNGGLPTAGIITTPLENKERLETLKGANALMFGIASPGGIVNMVTKRATDADIQTGVLTASSFGAFAAAADFGRKFGPADQFGARLIGALNHVETGVRGGTGRSQFISGAFDWRALDVLLVKLDLEYYDRDVVEQAGLQPLKPVNGVIPIPRVPDPRNLLSGDWAHYTPVTFNWDLRTDYAFTPAWTAIAEVGRSYSDRTRFSDRLTNYNLGTGQGTLVTTFLNNQKYINQFERLEIVGSFASWFLAHDVTIGVARAERDFNNPQVSNSSQPQNAYDPSVTVAPVFSTTMPPTTPQVSRDYGLYGYDTISLAERWKLLLGFRETYYHADNQDSPGGPHSIRNTRTPSPAYGLIYEFAPRSEVYASYMEGLEETGTAPIGTVNQYQILPPAVAKQKEVGFRTSYSKRLTVAVAYFDIERANATVDPRSNTFVLDGVTRFRGVELTSSFRLTQDLSFTVAGLYLDAQEHPNDDLMLEGLRPENTAKVSGNFNVNYKIPLLRGLVVRAGTSYVGARFVNDADQGRIPSVQLYDAGLGYSANIDRHPVSFQMTVDNLTNKRYWNSATTSQLGAGMDRSLRFNFRMGL